jgi:hypothetical protein
MIYSALPTSKGWLILIISVIVGITILFFALGGHMTWNG